MEGIRPGLCARVCWTRPKQLAVGTDLRVLEEPDFPGRGVQGSQEGMSVCGGGSPTSLLCEEQPRTAFRAAA